MPLTAPTSSAMVTTRMARLRLIFQLVRMVGSVAGRISLRKNCAGVGRNERSMSRKSADTPFMPSRKSIRNTGAHTTISTNAMRNSTHLNQSTENRIQQTTGTAMSSRTSGLP